MLDSAQRHTKVLLFWWDDFGHSRLELGELEILMFRWEPSDWLKIDAIPQMDPTCMAAFQPQARVLTSWTSKCPASEMDLKRS